MRFYVRLIANGERFYCQCIHESCPVSNQTVDNRSAQRGKHRVLVVPYKGRALAEMHDTGWKKTRKRAARAWEEEMKEAAAEGFQRLLGA